MFVTQALNFAKQKSETLLYNQAAPFLQHEELLNKIIASFADEKSRQYFIQEIAYLMSRGINKDYADNHISPFSVQDYCNDAKKLPALLSQPGFPALLAPEDELKFLANMVVTTFISEQYRYDDIVTISKDDVVLDCGACFGDTAIWAYRCGAKEVYSFEPSPFNFPFLQANLEKCGYDKEKAFMLAVGDEVSTIPFFAAPGVAGSGHALEKTTENAEDHADRGVIHVDCVKLDDFLKEKNIEPTFIKMDIEGAEPGALLGCAETIKRLKPKLTICLYHNISDMWTIPDIIHTLVPEYKFYCRKNNYANEFILYATI